MDREPRAQHCNAWGFFRVGEGSARTLLLWQHVGCRRTVRISRRSDQNPEGACHCGVANDGLYLVWPVRSACAVDISARRTDLRAVAPAQRATFPGALFGVEHADVSLRGEAVRRSQVL